MWSLPGLRVVELSLLWLMLLPTCQGLKLGLIDGDNAITTICQRAITDAKATGQCTAETVDVLNTSSCDGNALGTANAVNLHYKSNVDAFVAPMCQDEMEEVSRLSYFFNSPVISRVVSSAGLVNLDYFPNVIQVAASSVQAIGVTISEVAKQIEEDNLVIVGPILNGVKPTTIDLSIALDAYYKQNKLLKVRQLYSLPIDKLSEYAQTIRKLQSKLIVLTDDFITFAGPLTSLNVEFLTSKGHIVLIVCRKPYSSCIGADTETFSKTGALALVPEDSDIQRRIDQFGTMLGTDYKSDQFDRYRTTYDACFAYCWAAWKGNTNNGKTFSETFVNATWTNAMGTTRFDGGYSLMQTYSVVNLPSSTKVPQNLLTLIPTPKTCVNSTCLMMTPNITIPAFWINAANTTVDYTGLNAIIQTNMWLYITIGTVAVICCGAAVFYYYWSKGRNNMFRLTWRVMSENMKIIEGPKRDRGEGAAGRQRKRAVPYALIGTVKAEFVALKQVRRVRFTEEDMLSLMNLKRLSHDNLAPFIGVGFNQGNVFYVMNALVERASLEEFIKDQEFNMDETFKSAFMRDICRGLSYLHKSAVGYHGLLNLGNCLVDGNWVLKLSQFGYSNLLKQLIVGGHIEVVSGNAPGNISSTAGLSQNTYLYTAPECLQDIEIMREFPKGNDKADIYSLGTVLYCILAEQHSPYNIAGAGGLAALPKFTTAISKNFEEEEEGKVGKPKALEPKTFPKIIEEVITMNLRPSFGEGMGVKQSMQTLLEQCWDKDPEKRPNIRDIQTTIQSAFAQSQGNLIDQMIKMNERYANNLESIVANREVLLRDAQEQTNRLLNEMLPESIAAQLKAKEEIIPRSYEAATVLFCQLVDFGLLIEKTSAEYIISFLNDVFNRFDEIIKAHDAYKVETTGETYMVASGVPSENAGRHVFEIADIALELREKSYAYKVENMDDYKVRVRIGFHCGPIAAGVIGIKSPRYCLFGDTVNFASRMQSNCPPNQIQTSEITARKLMENPDYELVQRGIVKVKGKGDVNCYWLNEHIHGEHGIVAEQIIVGGGRPPTAQRAFARPLPTTTAAGRQSSMSVQHGAVPVPGTMMVTGTSEIMLIEPPPVRLMTAARPRSRRTSKIEEVIEEVAEETIDGSIDTQKPMKKKQRFIDDKKSQ